MEAILKLLGENPNMILPIIKGYLNEYKPLVYGILQEFVEIYKDYSENTEYPAIAAKVKKNMYDAYVNAGFTEDQAMALMINDNIQLMNGIKKTVNNSINSNNRR